MQQGKSDASGSRRSRRARVSGEVNDWDGGSVSDGWIGRKVSINTRVSRIALRLLGCLSPALACDPMIGSLR